MGIGVFLPLEVFGNTEKAFCTARWGLLSSFKWKCPPVRDGGAVWLVQVMVLSDSGGDGD